MTEKQFTTKNIICSSYCVWDSDDKPYGNDEVVELLNELHDENQKLKKKLGIKQRLINAYENYIETLKEDGVLR